MSDDVFCTLYNRNPALIGLAEAALAARTDGVFIEPGVFLTSTPVAWKETAYGIAGGRQLAAGETLDALCDQLLAQRMAVPTFAIEVRRIPASIRGAHTAKAAVADCIGGDVDFQDPDMRLLLVRSTWGFRLLVVDDATAGDPGWLETAHKPNNVPVALSARLARAAIHLSARPGDTLFDPFCGSGTIPLVAAFEGHRAFGSDISTGRVAQAQANAVHFGQDVAISRCDARTTRQRADCIVTNPPYGAFCHLSEGGMRATLENLKPLAPRVTLVTTQPLSGLLTALGYDIERVITIEPDRCERFIYLTRTGAVRSC